MDSSALAWMAWTNGAFHPASWKLREVDLASATDLRITTVCNSVIAYSP